MHKRRPDLIVPIRDRRQRKRYLTLRNARNVFIGLAVLFIAITIRSEMQPRHADSFGRLLDRQLPKVESQPVEVVKEAPPPITDQSAPDPMLVAPVAREQWLHDDTATTAAAAIEPIPVPVTITPRAGRSDIAIVGGPEGIAVVRGEQRRPLLKGGFGRQP